MIAEKTVYAGDTIEVSRYHINCIPKGPRKKKKESTPERIKKANLRRRTDRLRQLMNANFDDTCWSLTLTYRKGEEPKSIRAVRKDAADFVRKLRQCARLFGVDVKFIYTIGAGKHRRHIHITVNSLPDMAIFAGCWIHGHVSMTKLYSNGQYRDLVDYYILNGQETKEQEEALGESPGQMYVTSKNLTQPIEKKRMIFGRFKGDPETVPGYYLEKESIYKGFTSMGFPLLRYTLMREKRDGKTAISVDRRRAEDIRQGKVHIPRDVVDRNTKPRGKRRASGGKSGSGLAGGIVGGITGIFRKAKADVMHSLRMPLHNNVNQSKSHGKMGKQRLQDLKE